MSKTRKTNQLSCKCPRRSEVCIWPIQPIQCVASSRRDACGRQHGGMRVWHRVCAKWVHDAAEKDSRDRGWHRSCLCCTQRQRSKKPNPHDFLDPLATFEELDRLRVQLGQLQAGMKGLAWTYAKQTDLSEALAFCETSSILELASPLADFEATACPEVQTYHW